MKKGNNIEKYFEDKLKAKGIKYKREFHIDGTHKNKKYDFLINTNTIIEIDGPYHDTPKQIQRDKKYTNIAIQKGFHVVRIEANKKYIDAYMCGPLNSKNVKYIGSEDFKKKHNTNSIYNICTIM